MRYCIINIERVQVNKDLILITDNVCDNSGYLTDAQYHEFMNIARKEFMKANNIDNNTLEYFEFKLKIHKHIKVGDSVFVIVEKREQNDKLIFSEFIYDQSNNLRASGVSFFTSKAL